MEHLPWPESCQPRWTPYGPFHYLHKAPKYDWNGFKGFLHRTGWTEAALILEIKDLSVKERPLNLEHQDRAELAVSILQEWCWFGLLDECSREFGVAVKSEDFIASRSRDGENDLLTTSCLGEYFRKVASSCIDRPKREEPIRYSKLGRCVTVIDRVTSALDPLTLPRAIRMTLFYIGVFCEAIQSAVKVIFNEPMLRPISCSIPTPEMWCESRRNYLRIPGSLSLRVLSKSIPSHDYRSHESCTREGCSFSPPRSCPVRPAHTEDCSQENCREFSIEDEQLSRIYQEDGIPGIKLTDDRDKMLVEDVRFQKYVAISHVWSHGLGNSLSNSLPWCQVNRLMRLVRSLAGSEVLLWIDTLVVPHDPTNKQKAITKLRHIYREAEAVLVLDRYLEQVGTDALERSLQLLGSEWMTRLWTLQEGRLARNLCFSFKDAIVHIDALLDPMEHATPEAQRNIFIDIGAIRRILEDLFISCEDTTRRFSHLAVNLAYRSVTVPSDEPICLATLLGIPLERFIEHAPTMADVYTAFPDHLPQDLVFFHGARLPDKGLRWAPASLLRQPTFHNWTYQSGKLVMGEDDTGDGKETMTGLVMDKDFITFDSNDPSAPEPVSTKHAYVTGPLIDGVEKLAFFLMNPPEDVELPPLQDTAVVLHTPGNIRPPSSKAVLVEKGRVCGDVLCCRFICNVQTTRGVRIDWAIETLWGSALRRSVAAKLETLRICID